MPPCSIGSDTQDTGEKYGGEYPFLVTALAADRWGFAAGGRPRSSAREHRQATADNSQDTSFRLVTQGIPTPFAMGSRCGHERD